MACARASRSASSSVALNAVATGITSSKAAVRKIRDLIVELRLVDVRGGINASRGSGRR
jgi:hypothetical protein